MYYLFHLEFPLPAHTIHIVKDELHTSYIFLSIWIFFLNEVFKGQQENDWNYFFRRIQLKTSVIGCIHFTSYTTNLLLLDKVYFFDGGYVLNKTVKKVFSQIFIFILFWSIDQYTMKFKLNKPNLYIDYLYRVLTTVYV